VFLAEGGKPTGAISISLEHRAGGAVTVFMPYSKRRFRAYEFGDLVAGPGDRRIFG
jgi:hypothetical protein